MKIIKGIRQFGGLTTHLNVHFPGVYFYCIVIQLNRIYVLRNNIYIDEKELPIISWCPLGFDRGIVYA